MRFCLCIPVHWDSFGHWGSDSVTENKICLCLLIIDPSDIIRDIISDFSFTFKCVSVSYCSLMRASACMSGYNNKSVQWRVDVWAGGGVITHSSVHVCFYRVPWLCLLCDREELSSLVHVFRGGGQISVSFYIPRNDCNLQCHYHARFRLGMKFFSQPRN